MCVMCDLNSEICKVFRHVRRNNEKRQLAICLSICQGVSTRLPLDGFFCEIWYCVFLRKYIENIWIWLKSDKNISLSLHRLLNVFYIVFSDLFSATIQRNLGCASVTMLSWQPLCLFQQYKGKGKVAFTWKNVTRPPQITTLYIHGLSDWWLTVHRNSVWIRKTN